MSTNKQEALYDMIDSLAGNSDPCWLDHHGGCQEHGYISLKPGEVCPYAEAKVWLAENKPGETLQDRIAKALSDQLTVQGLLFCTRDESGWSEGTMGHDDFRDAGDDPSIATEMAEAIMPILKGE